MRLGVLLLNLGGPESMKDVEGFLYNLFADPDIIRLPSFLSLLQKPIAYVIAKRRAPKSSEAYRSIGGGSPIVHYTQQQADLIRQTLVDKYGLDSEATKVYFAMRYWNPYTEEVLAQIRKDRVNTLVIVPLYPQYSISTSGSSLKLLEEIFFRESDVWGPAAEHRVSHTVVPAWYHRPGYVKVMARLILTELGHFSRAEMAEGVHVLFSAHGVPQSYIQAGDPYQRQIEECVRLISREVSHMLQEMARNPSFSETQIPPEVALSLAGANPNPTNPNPSSPALEVDMDALEMRLSGESSVGVCEGSVSEVQYHLSFQSRVGPVKWLQPYTEETLVELGVERQVRNLVVVPVSFVSEHIETLEEIDMEYRELALESGVRHWRRVPALNTDRLFIEDMADLVVEALENPALSVSEATSGHSDFIDSQGHSSGLVGNDAAGFGMGASRGSSSGPFGLTDSAEKLNGRFAMLGLLGTTLLEVLNGHPVLPMLGIR